MLLIKYETILMDGYYTIPFTDINNHNQAVVIHPTCLDNGPLVSLCGVYTSIPHSLPVPSPNLVTCRIDYTESAKVGGHWRTPMRLSRA